MAVKRVELRNLAREIDGFSRATLKKQQAVVADSMARAIPRLVAASPHDTGLYAQSWDFTIEEKRAIIGNYAPYASVIEFGARPHPTPIAPLLAWAKRVLGDPSQPPDYSSEVWALAKAVQKKLATQGQAPRHILENQIPLIIEDIKRSINAILS